GEAYLQVQRRAEAAQCAQEALSLSREHTERGHEAHALRLLGDLALGDPVDREECEAFYRQAIARAEELEMRPLLAQCYLGLGRRHMAAGRQERAKSRLTAAGDLFPTLDMPFLPNRPPAQLASLRSGRFGKANRAASPLTLFDRLDTDVVDLDAT